MKEARITEDGDFLLGSNTKVSDDVFGADLQSTTKSGRQHVLFSGHTNTAGNANLFES